MNDGGQRSSRRKAKRLRHPLHLSPGRFTRPGAVPGDLSAATVEQERSPVRFDVIDFDDTTLVEHNGCSVDEARAFFSSPKTTWLHVQGTPDTELLRELGDAYELHSLALEDVLHTGQRSKLEAYDQQLFAIVGLPEAEPQSIRNAQLSLFLGESWVVSFYSGTRDPFKGVRDRLHREDSRLRHLGSDYLFYSLIDTAVDHFFPVIENLGERIEALELSVFDDPSRESLDEIHRLKRELVLLRRMLWPQRDMLGSLMRDDFRLVKTGTRLYLRDCHDHCVHALDLVESYREMASSLLEVYLSSLSNRMNDVMKVLTIIATIFIPLSFVVGLYGMNFDRSASPWNMPELGMRFGYPGLLLFLLCVVALMIYYFRRKRWL